MASNYLQLLRFYPQKGSQHDCRCGSGQEWDKPVFRLLTPVDRLPAVTLRIPRSTVPADRLKDLFACITLLSYPDGREIESFRAPSDVFRILGDDDYYYVVANEQEVSGLMEGGKTYCLHVGGADLDVGYWSEPFEAVDCGCLTRIELGHTAMLGDVPYQTNIRQVFYTREKLCDGEPETETGTTSGNKATYQRQTRFKRLDLDGLPDYVVDVLMALPMHTTVTVSAPGESFDALPGRSSVSHTPDTCCYANLILRLAERQTELRAAVGCEPVGNSTDLEEQTTSNPDVCTNISIWTPADLAPLDQGPSVLPALPPVPSRPLPIPPNGSFLSESSTNTTCQAPYVKDGIKYTRKTTKVFANGVGGTYTTEVFSNPCTEVEDDIIDLEVDLSIPLPEIIGRVGQSLDQLLAPFGLFKPVAGQTLTVTATNLPPGTAYSNTRLAGTPTQEGDFDVKLLGKLSGGGRASVVRRVTVYENVPDAEALKGLAVDYSQEDEKATVRVKSAIQPVVKAVAAAGQRLIGGGVFVPAVKVDGQVDTWAYTWEGAAKGKFRFHAKGKEQPGEGITFEVVLDKTGTMKQDLQNVAMAGNETNQTLIADRFVSANVVDNPSFEYIAVWLKEGERYVPAKIHKSQLSGGNTSDPPTIPQGIRDQQYVVGQQFTVQFPEFPGATRYVFSTPPAGLTAHEPTRTVSGKGTQVGETTVQLTAIGPGGEVTVEIKFTGIPQSAPTEIQSVYIGDNNNGQSLSMYLFGNGEPAGGINYEIVNGTGTVVIPARKWTYEPNKYNRPGLFEGFAPYWSLLIGLAAGNYSLRTWTEGSSNVLEIPFSYSPGLQSQVYPALINLITGKPVTASSNANTAPNSNDGDPDTFWESTAESDPATQYDLGKNYRMTQLGINTGGGPADFWIIGYPASVIPPDPTVDLGLSNIVPGITIRKSVGGSLPTGMYNFEDVDAVVRYIRVQKNGNTPLKIKEILAMGTEVANEPPKQISAIPDQVVTEGDPWMLNLAEFFTDLDALNYTSKIVDGSNLVNPYSWTVLNPNGMFNAAATVVEGGGTSKTTKFRVFVSDGKAEVTAEFNLIVNKRNTSPANVIRARMKLDLGNGSITGLLQLDGGGTAELEIFGVGFDYPQGVPAKGLAPGTYNDNGQTFNLRAVGFFGGQAGKTYRARFKVPNGVYERSFTFPAGSGNQTVDLPVDSAGGDNYVTNVYLDETRLAQAKKVTARSEASGLTQFGLKDVNGVTIFQYTDGSIPAGKSYYEFVSDVALTEGKGFVLESRLKAFPNIKKTYAFTAPVSNPNAPAVKRIGIAPTVFKDGYCVGVTAYAELTSGEVSMGWFFYVGNPNPMQQGNYPDGYNRALSTNPLLAGVNQNFDQTYISLWFYLPGQSTPFFKYDYQRNGDSQGFIREIYNNTGGGGGGGGSAGLAFSTPKVMGLDTRLAKVTRQVESGEIRYSIIPQNIPPGFVCYVLLPGETYANGFVNKVFNPQQHVSVHLYISQRAPHYSWQVRYFELFVPGSPEYVIRQNLLLNGNQFFIETGLTTN